MIHKFMHCKQLASYLKTVQTLLLTGTRARAKNTMAAISICHCSSLLLHGLIIAMIFVAFSGWFYGLGLCTQRTVLLYTTALASERPS